MEFPQSTGRAARLLGCTEPKLSEEVRRGRVSPAPPIMAGRRLWGPKHLLQAAESLGLPEEGLRAELVEEIRRHEGAPTGEGAE